MYDLVNETGFNLEKSQEYILSIQISLDGFSFSVVSPSDNKLLAFKKKPLEPGDEKLVAKHFKEWIDSNDIFQNSFKTIRIILFQDNFTIVPDKFISEELKNTIPSLLFSPVYDSFKITENPIESSDLKLLFTINQDLEVVLNKKFGEYKLVHPVGIISRHLKQIKRKYGFVLLFNSNSLYTVLYTESNIVLANCFEINHANDAIYYALAILKQLKIPPKSTEVFYCGKITDEKDTLAQLENHFGATNPFITANPPYFESEEFEQIVHQNVALLS